MKANIKEIDSNSRPFFVIVHGNFVDPVKNRQQYDEIKRIKEEENFSEVTGTPSNTRLDMPRSRKILVCGAYHTSCYTLCVDEQLYFLKKAGYNAQIYDKATVQQTTRF